MTDDARAAAQRGDWATAGESLGLALALELNAEDNDWANRAWLVGLQAMAADGQDFDRARHLRREQLRLESNTADSINGTKQSVYINSGAPFSSG